MAYQVISFKFLLAALVCAACHIQVSREEPEDVFALYCPETNDEIDRVEHCFYDNPSLESQARLCESLRSHNWIGTFVTGWRQESVERMQKLYQQYKNNANYDRHMVRWCYLWSNASSKPIHLVQNLTTIILTNSHVLTDCPPLLSGPTNITVMTEPLVRPAEVDFELADPLNLRRRPWNTRRQLLRQRYWHLMKYCDRRTLPFDDPALAKQVFEWCAGDKTVPVPKRWVSPPLLDTDDHHEVQSQIRAAIQKERRTW